MTHFSDLTLATTTHNNAQTSAAMLESFETNLGTVDKIVIVDDGSSRPCTLPPVSSAVRLIRNEQPHGFCHASDVALRAVRTRYALLVDADVLFEPGDFGGGYAEFQKDKWAWVNFRQTNFQGQSDMDLSLRLRQAGYRVGVDLGYGVKHEGAGGKSGGAARVLDLYRSRVHLYENFYPASRLYLRPLLFVRHLVELAWFAAV